MVAPVCSLTRLAQRHSGRVFGGVNTNVQTHSDRIWSFTFDPSSAVTIIVWSAIIVAVVLIVAARRRKKP